MKGNHQILHRSVVIRQEDVALGINPGFVNTFRHDPGDEITKSGLIAPTLKGCGGQRFEATNYHVGGAGIGFPIIVFIEDIHVREGLLKSVYVSPEKCAAVEFV